MFKYICNIEMFARIKFLKHLFFCVELYMDPLGIVDINLFVVHGVQLWFESYQLFLQGFFKSWKIVSEVEFYLDPLVIVDINLYVVHWVQPLFEPYLLLKIYETWAMGMNSFSIFKGFRCQW